MEQDIRGWELSQQDEERRRRNSSGSVASMFSLDGDQFFEAASNGDTAAWQLPEGSQTTTFTHTNLVKTADNTESSTNNDAGFDTNKLRAEQIESPASTSDEATAPKTAPDKPIETGHENDAVNDIDDNDGADAAPDDAVGAHDQDTEAGAGKLLTDANPSSTPPESPIEEPTATPIEEPTATPIEEPTATPIEEPTNRPAKEPTSKPMDEDAEYGAVDEPAPGLAGPAMDEASVALDSKTSDQVQAVPSVAPKADELRVFFVGRDNCLKGPFSPVKIRNWYYAKKISGKVQARFDFETELSNLSGVISQIEQRLGLEPVVLQQRSALCTSCAVM